MVVQQIGPKLLDGIARAESPQVKAELLDTLHTCLVRFGTGAPELHGGVEECLLAFLSHSNATVRKRCIQCAAALGFTLVLWRSVILVVHLIDATRKVSAPSACSANAQKLVSYGSMKMHY